MRFYASIVNGRIVPESGSDYDKFAKLPRGKSLRFEVKQERNYKFHKKVMALFNLGFENQEEFAQFDVYRKVMTMRAGFFDEIKTEKGVMYWPRSISFAKMDETEFRELFDKLFDVVCAHLGADKDDVREMIADFY